LGKHPDLRRKKRGSIVVYYIKRNFINLYWARHVTVIGETRSK
jgi:hypothetical protein